MAGLQDVNGCPNTDVPPPGPVPWWQFVLIVILATMSGMFSGLNLGLLSLDV